MNKKHMFSFMLACLAMALTALMFFFPQATFDGASYGLKTWALILVPSLLPFLIIADLLMELGVVRFFGVLLEPLMRPIFKQPGEAGFVMAMGFTSGFPMGAVLTNSLYEKNICTREESGRLVSFTNNSSPLFLLVAVPVGMFGMPELGIIFLLAHYLSNLTIGILLAFGARKITHPSPMSHNNHLLKSSLRELAHARDNNPLPLAKILGNAINKGIKSILSIGGFVLFFSVLISVLNAATIFPLLIHFFASGLALIGFDPVLSNGLAHGLFEMTLGARKIAEATSAPLLEQVVITSMILGWSGLSIQAQVSSILAQNKLPTMPYHLSRLAQCFLAGAFTLLLIYIRPDTFPALNLSLFANTQPFSLYLTLFAIPLINLLVLIALSSALYLSKKIWLKRSF